MSIAPRIETRLFRAHTIAALATLMVSAIFGVLVALKFDFPDWLGGTAWLTWGRLRYDHTQGIFFGWLGNAFLAFLYHVVPRLSDRPVTSPRLGALLFFIWNFVVVLPGWVLVLAGFSQPLEWAEFPLVVDAFVVLAFVLSIIQFAIPLVRTRISELYVSGWYILGALVFTTLAYPVGNVVPELVSGAGGAAFSGLWIHDAVGVYVTPLVLAMAYWVIPIASGRPLYSHFLSMVGFWLLFLVYPLNGTHHYVFSAIPMAAQKGAIVASVYLGFDVVLVVTNLLLTLRGAKSNLALRFVRTGTIFYLIVSLQGAGQALMPLNKFLHFSDWVVGHSHLAMIGFASFTAIGALGHAWQRTPGVRFNEKAFSWTYRLLLSSLLVMVIDLTAAGLVQSRLWASGAPWIESVRASSVFWVFRAITFVPIFSAFVAFAVALATGPRVSLAPAKEPAPEEPSAKPSFFASAYVITFVAGIGLFLFSFALLGLWPARTLEREVAETNPPIADFTTASIERGRAIYAREGCAYCHTEQVRSVTADTARFGAATSAWETKLDYPHLWGTRRIGPDLSRETGIRTNDWQAVHLFNPRFVVPDSVMPRYPWLFTGDATQPTREGRDLVAYLQSLGRPRVVAGLASLTSADVMPDFGGEASPENGARLFASNCAGCHGAAGRGDGPAASTLYPRPANLTNESMSRARVGEISWRGRAGTSMPAWRDFPVSSLRDLAAFVAGLHPPDSAPSPAASAETKALFVKECATCHGETGGGDGIAGLALAPSPTPFKKQRPDRDRARASIAEGIPGSGMPRWKEKIDEADRDALADYVRSFYEGAP